MAIIISNGATITANTPAVNLSDLLVFDFDMANFSAEPVIGGSIVTTTNQLIRIPTNEAFTYGTGDFTIEWWSLQTSSSGVQGIWRNSTGDAVNSIGFWTITQANRILTVSIGNGTTTDTINSNSAISLSIWNHYAFVRTGNVFKLYVNGVAQTQTLTSSIELPPQLDASYMQIGNAGGFYMGRITNFRIVKGTAVYTTNFTPPTQPLKAISGTSLLLLAGDSSNFLTDRGPNAFTITNVGATFSSTSPFASVREAKGNFTMVSSAPTYSSTNGGSLIFNGTSDAILCTGNTMVTAATFLCWIRRNGTQGTYDGIIFSRGTSTTGMGFYSSNQLGYTWNNAANTYNWASGLTIPDLTWCMVAVSITPTSATAYLCQSSGTTTATNTVSHTSTTLDDIKIGIDEFSSRYFTGNIGIAQIYTTALSAAQISQKFEEDRARFGI
jgi:hypothetical protein